MEGSEAVARLRLPLLPVMSAAPDRTAGWGAYAMTEPGLTSVGRTGRHRSGCSHHHILCSTIMISCFFFMT